MKKYIYKISALLLVIVGLTACLKDDDGLVLNPENGSNVIEFDNTAEIAVHGSSIPLYVHSYEITPAGATLTVTLSYSGPESGAPQDINVKFGLGDNASITKYNSEQNTSFQPMPANYYTINATEVTIPKGQKKASFTILFKTDQFDLTKAFVLPLKINSVSAGTISSNFNVILLNVGAKNAYDGVFQYTTSANTSLVPNRNSETVLVTVNATTVKISPGLLDTYSNEVTYTVNPTTNAVTVTCPSLGVQTPQDTRSKWDPATKTMTVFWKQGNGGRTFEEKFVYKRSR